MGVPLNHPFLDGYSLINHPFWVPPFQETPIWIIYTVHLKFYSFHSIGSYRLIMAHRSKLSKNMV